MGFRSILLGPTMRGAPCWTREGGREPKTMNAGTDCRERDIRSLGKSWIKNEETIQYRFHSTGGSREASVTSPNVKADDGSATGCGGPPGRVKRNSEMSIFFASPAKCSWSSVSTACRWTPWRRPREYRSALSMRRYADNATLFHAVLSDLISRWLVPIDRFQTEQGELEDISYSLSRVT